MLASFTGVLDLTLVVSLLMPGVRPGSIDAPSLPHGQRYRIEPTREDTWETRNTVQGTRATFTAKGITIGAQDWSLTLSLEAWGRHGALLPVPDAACRASGARIEYQRGSILESYVNEQRGLEQWFTLHERPEGDGPVHLVLGVAQDFSAEVAPGGRDARFIAREGKQVLHYTGLRAWDARERQLEASLVAGEHSLAIVVDDEEAHYPLTIDPLMWVEVAKLKASDEQPKEGYGLRVSLSGDTVLIGASKADYSYLTNAGAAYVYERDFGGPEAWGEVVKITASDARERDRFGYSTDIDADRAVIGAFRVEHSGFTKAGAAYIYERHQGGPSAWGEVTKLTASDPRESSGYGIAVAVAGDTVLVGGPRAGETGSVYVYERDSGGPGAWGEADRLASSSGAAGDRFGCAVDLDGDTALIGAHAVDTHSGGLNAGAAYVFVRQGTTWVEQAELLASDGAPGDRLGGYVALSGGTAIVSAVRHDTSWLIDAGAAYVFVRTGQTWSEQAKLTAGSPQIGDRFGRSVSISGDIVAVGADREDNLGLLDLGVAHMYSRTGTSWTEAARLAPSDPTFAFYFGQGVSVDGDSVVVGSAALDSTMNFKLGAAYVFKECCPSLTYCAPGASTSGCQVSLGAAGRASATTPSGFALQAEHAPGRAVGLFLYGTGGRQAEPWGPGSSQLCVAPPRWRTALIAGGGTEASCNGWFAWDLNAQWCAGCPDADKNPGPGTLVQAQLWYQDPADPGVSGLSNAIEFLVGP